MAIGLDCGDVGATSVGPAVGSDKHYWHRYSAFYEPYLARLGKVTDILEFGVLDGQSIGWLHKRFPAARIVGADILPLQPQWPRASRIEYVTVDQGNRAGVAGMFGRLDRRFDLIIEDGSHIPEHQATCLLLGLERLRTSGLYMLEDVHTSHAAHPYSAKQPKGTPNALTVLLAIQHMKETGRAPVREITRRLVHPKFFAAEDVERLFELIDSVELYRRTSLPLSCYNCRDTSFDYRTMRCKCGAELFADTDSMAFAIVRA